jgi:protease-4
VAIGTVAVAPASARAADPIVVQRQLSDGVDRPIHDIAGEGDASSAEVNPALVGDVRGLDFTLLGTHTFDRFGRGDGFGAFMAVNLLRFAALGFGVQALRPAFDGGRWDFDADHQPSATKLGVTLTSGDSRWATLGASVSGIRTAEGWLRSPDLDLGLVVRGSNWLSIGMVARMAPTSLDATVYRSFLTLDSELAIRPLGARWIEVAGGIRSRMDQSNGTGLTGFRSAINGHARLGLRWQGLGLNAELEQVPVVSLDEDTLEPNAVGSAWRGGLALDFAFGYGMASVGTSLGPGVPGSGITLKARLGTERLGQGYWLRPVDAERIDLSSISGERDLIALLQRLRRAERDGARAILVLDARGSSMGWASAQELRDAVIAARNAGAHVFAYLEYASIKDLFLASAAEKVFVHPGGEVAPYGLSSSALYFRDALAKLGVRVEAMHIREYKSAHERFTRGDRSEYDREQTSRLLQVVYDTVVHDVAQGRGLTLAQVRGHFDESPHTPKAAVDLGLVDGIVHRDELDDEIAAAIGSPFEFRKFRPNARERETWGAAPYYAVILVEGTIVDGKSLRIPFIGINFAGGDTLAAQIRERREDPACKGIILRVNSPGGSALASEIVWREAALTHQAWEQDPAINAPIVVSMGDVAASGGYYVAATGAEIVASPTTITGSIGVVSQHFDLSGLLDLLGVGVDTITVGRNPDIQSLYKPFTPEQRERLEVSMQHTYDLFRRRVSDARDLSMERVDEVGRGHVWVGADAVGLDLVDELGGLRTAVERLRAKSTARKLPPVALRVFPKRGGILGMIFDQAEPFAKVHAVRTARREQARGLSPVVGAVKWVLAELPLRSLLLPHDRAHAMMDATITIE